MAARMPVADRTIQCHARSGPLIAWDGGRLVPGRDITALCFPTPTWRCRPIPVPFALVFPAGVATSASAVDRSAGWFRLSDASGIAFTRPVSEAWAEPAVALPASGKTSACGSGICAGGLKDADAS